jgi:hypothetical protein
MDRLIQMVINTFLRRFMNQMVNRGVDHFAGKGKPPEEMTAEERKQARAARQAAKRSREIAKMVRRIK